MSTEPTPDENVDQSVDQPVEPTVDDTADETNPNREAAKYRRQLRDTEAERDQLRQSLTEARRAVLAEHPALKIIARTAFDDAVPNPDALFSDDGKPDPARIREAVETIRNSRPHLLDRRPRFPTPPGRPSGADPDRDPFVEAFTPRHKRVE